MRIIIDFNNKEKPRMVTLVETFLSYHLATKFYGEAYDSIFVDFIENPKPNKKFKRRILYGHNAEIEVVKEFSYESQFTLDEFKKVFDAFNGALKYLDEVEIKKGTIDSDALRSDIESLGLKLPSNMQELRYWEKTDEIKKKIHDKIVFDRNNNPEFDKRQQAKQIPLREFLMSFEDVEQRTIEAIELERGRKKHYPFVGYNLSL